MKSKIIYEDDTLLAVDKPPGLTIEEVHKEFALSGLPRAKSRGVEGPAHRLDKDTSGILLLAKDKQTLEFLQKQFKDRKIEKKYLCLVEGNAKQESDTIHTLLGRSPADRRKQRTYSLSEVRQGRREAITEWKVLQRFENYTLLEVTPKTGRKHQIRAHMAAIGHPIAGDKLYGFKNQSLPQGLKRQFLHASSLKIGGQKFISKLPQDLQNVLEKLQG